MLSAARSSQANVVIVLLAIWAAAAIVIAVCLVEEWIARRHWRRVVARAHEPRPFGKPAAPPKNPSNRSC